MTKNPRVWNRSSPYNPPTGYTMLSSHNGLDTGAQKRGASPTPQSQVKDHDSKTKSTVSVKPFFATPFFWNYALDGEVRGANETKYVDIFTCSRMLIPVNIKLKHWILSCIDFEQKWMAWLDSIGDTHEQETRILFTWLAREYSINRSTIFDPDEWSLHSDRPPGIQVPLQSNNFDC